MRSVYLAYTRIREKSDAARSIDYTKMYFSCRMLFVMLLIVMNSINSIIRITAIYNFNGLQMNASGNYIVTITLHSYSNLQETCAECNPQGFWLL